MKRQIILTLLIFSVLVASFLFVVPMVSAETAFYVPKNQDYNLKFSCDLEGNLCPSTTFCNITISPLQNSSILIDNNATTNLNNGFFNITLNSSQNSQAGEYQSHVVCYDSSSGLNDTASFIYEVNPNGIRPSSQKSSAINVGMWFFIVLAVLLFIAFLFVKFSIPVKWTFFLVAIIFALISINLLSVNIQDQVVNPRLESFFDSFTAISFIMYWFAFGMLAIMWILTFFQTWIYKKNMQNFKRFGG